MICLSSFESFVTRHSWRLPVTSRKHAVVAHSNSVTAEKAHRKGIWESCVSNTNTSSSTVTSCWARKQRRLHQTNENSWHCYWYSCEYFTHRSNNILVRLLFLWHFSKLHVFQKMSLVFVLKFCSGKSTVPVNMFAKFLIVSTLFCK